MSGKEIYFAQEYAGLHDPAEGSLESAGSVRSLKTVAAWIQLAACRYWTVQPKPVEGYFRPGTTHSERSSAEACAIWDLIGKPVNCSFPASRHGRTTLSDATRSHHQRAGPST